jgi:hypothetical protein
MIILGSITITKPYRDIEKFSKMNLENFIKEQNNVTTAKKSIKDYYNLLIEESESKFGQKLDSKNIPNFLIENEIIDSSTYSQLKDVTKLILNINKISDEDLYLNLVRILEIIEESYEQIELKFKTKTGKK